MTTGVEFRSCVAGLRLQRKNLHAGWLHTPHLQALIKKEET
jgi:hypothetical protein